MKRQAVEKNLGWCILSICCAIDVIYNLCRPPSLLVAEVFHFTLFSAAALLFGSEAFFRLRYGPDFRLKHPRSRYWASIVVAAIFVPAAIWTCALLSRDLFNGPGAGIVSGRFVVKQNHSSFKGFWVYQKVILDNTTGQTPSLTYLLRWDFLKEGRTSEITYSAASRFILTAVPLE